ncbi:DUF2924 domain-containing protein [Paracoccus sp. TK19116]|uniref:DUF2924 domain-containing protein n=1 Tax=Paracoccus albicereus TaxID=2922394 RepID=A0ABT1MP86_9RHOB|nr:DUF2924 domain-containing protein [Paracoccus albicereus]MCQ0970102.1 DUF2924 domain-containing protein [Paracoccus albicereus]
MAGQSRAHDAAETPIHQVARATRDELRHIWTALFDRPVPPSISQPLLRRILAFEIQLRQSGGWPAGLEKQLMRQRTPSRPTSRSPAAGGRLLRDWNGSTHVVEIVADGYLWNDRHWRSLSAIAREITGAHWSGPRFFGLNGAEAKGKGAQR